DHAALMRFTFPGDHAALLFDNVNNKGGLTLDTRRGVVTGFSDVKSGLSTGATRLFVYGVLDAPVTGGGRLDNEGCGVSRSSGAGACTGGKDVTGYLRLRPGADRTVTLRIATSLIGVDQARANLTRETPAGPPLPAVER